MKTILPSLLLFFLLCAPAGATSIDGTILASGRKPDRPFHKTLEEATKALGADAPKFPCTWVDAINPQFGGGWRFQFGSPERGSITVHIHRDGTKTKNPAAGGQEFLPGPHVSVPDAVSLADALIQKRLRGFFFTSARWSEKDDAWYVYFYNSSASWAMVSVATSRAVKLEYVNRRNQ